MGEAEKARFEYFDPGKSTFAKQVEEVDLGTGEVRAWWMPRREQDRLILEVVGVVGLFQMHVGGLTQEEIARRTGMESVEWEKLAQGILPGDCGVMAEAVRNNLTRLVQGVTGGRELEGIVSKLGTDSETWEK